MGRYQHGEAFCLMRYQTVDALAPDAEEEIIWNSRDGVTPFTVVSKNGKEMRHVDFHHDRCVPNHQPSPGQRIFIDARRDLLEPQAKSHVDQNWEHPKYPMKLMFDSKQEAVESFLKDWCEPGQPMLVTVKDDGSYAA